MSADWFAVHARINHRSRELGMTTVKALADAAAIPQTTLRRRLADPSQFYLSEVERLAAALDVTPGWLFVGDA
jgi:hypothetical protein